MIAAASVGVGAAAAELAGGSHPVLALLLPLVAAPVVLWRRPQVGFYGVVAATALVEQFDYVVGPRSGAVTAKVPFFHSITSGSGVTPAEIVLFLCILALVLTRLRDRTPILSRSPQTVAVGVLVGMATLFLFVGLASHADYKIAIWEIRPWFYLAVMYVLGTAFLSKAGSLRVMLWIYVLGIGAKALYGIEIWWSVRHLNPRPEAVLAHEEAFFFGLFLFITLGMWLFSLRGRLRVVATVLAPFVFFADMANTRRTAWAILGCGVLAMCIVAYARLGVRRKALRRLGLVAVALASVYFPTYWNHDGTLAQPARAVRSVIAPDARDLESNQYRVTENANLILNIRARKDLGSGFGVPIDYAIPIVNLQSIDSAIAFIPHDGVLYVWMRMGLLGELLFWMVIAVGVVSACRLARVADREAAFLGAVACAGLVGYVIMGAEDMGFFWFRIALCMGAILGAVEATRRRCEQAAVPPALGVRT